MLNDRAKDENIIKAYLILYAAYVALTIISYSLLSRGFIQTYGRYGIIAGLFIIYIYTHDFKLTLDRIPFCLVFLLVMFVSTNNSMKLFVCFMFFICADIVQFRDIVKISLITGVVTTIIIVLASQVGIIENYSFKRLVESDDSPITYVYAYGFDYYSTIPFLMLFFFLMYAYLRKNAMTWIEIIIGIVASTFQWVFLTCRLVSVVWYFGILLYVLIVKLKWLKTDSFVLKLVSIAGFPVCYITTLAMTVLYSPDNKFLYFINDKLMNLRLSTSVDVFRDYGIKPFGQYIEFYGVTSVRFGNIPKSMYNYVDSGYMRSLLCHGPIFLAILLALYIILAIQSFKKKDNVIAVWVTCIMVFTVLNNVWIDFDYNPLLLYIPTVLLKENSNGFLAKVLYGNVEYLEEKV